MMKKIITVLGARPQFIKAAAVSRYIKDNVNDICEIIVHTGQHYDHGMSDVFFNELDIPQPDYNLGIGSGLHGQQTGLMLIEIEKVLAKELPDMVLIYGDTNSTLAGALAAAKLHIPVAHVEAGLRSHNKRMPEEINRIVADHVASLLFAPTQHAVQTLKDETLKDENIFFVGDVMYDACLYYSERSNNHAVSYNLKPKDYILVTIHRAENTDNPEAIKILVNSLIALSHEYSIILPLHPRTKKTLQELGYLEQLSQAIKVIPPVSYLQMLQLEKNAALIITDSGGVQKEAFFYQIPCITIRTETEWVELLELGANWLVPPTSTPALVDAVKTMYGRIIPNQSKPYGNGNAAKQILDIIKRHI